MSASVTQNDKANRFRALHDGPGVFVIPNPWDAGSARLLAGLGFQALATSSAASATALGRKDGGLTRDVALAHARLIVDATDLPVSADLEKGFGDAPEVVAETIRLAARVGLVGCTIEDATGNPDSPLYDVRLAVERIAAAAQAVRALRFPFVLTARAHNLLYAAPSVDETIRRLQAFEKAGADVLFAPGLPDLAAVRAVCAALSKPVHFMVGIKGKSFSVDELAAAGVRRISLATSLYRAAMTGFLDAAREVKDTGQFGFLDRCVTTPELNKLMGILPCGGPWSTHLALKPTITMGQLSACARASTASCHPSLKATSNGKASENSLVQSSPESAADRIANERMLTIAGCVPGAHAVRPMLGQA